MSGNEDQLLPNIKNDAQEGDSDDNPKEEPKGKSRKLKGSIAKFFPLKLILPIVLGLFSSFASVFGDFGFHNLAKFFRFFGLMLLLFSGFQFVHLQRPDWSHRVWGSFVFVVIFMVSTWVYLSISQFKEPSLSEIRDEIKIGFTNIETKIEQKSKPPPPISFETRLITFLNKLDERMLNSLAQNKTLDVDATIETSLAIEMEKFCAEPGASKFIILLPRQPTDAAFSVWSGGITKKQVRFQLNSDLLKKQEH